MADNARFARIPSAFSGPNDQNGKVPVLFQVVSPDKTTLLLPVFLYMHVNPSEISFNYSQNIERFETMGGFVEQHFGEELIDVSASNSTGTFVSVENGATTGNRRNTIAYRKMQHLIQIFKSNGSVYDSHGNVRFRGRIRIVFGGGIYDGFFETLEVSETADSPFSLELSWSFKVEEETQSLLY